MGFIDDVIDEATDTADDVGDAADTAVGGTVDTVLDNDVVSVQEAAQGTITQTYNLAAGGPDRSQDYVFNQLAGFTSSASENVGNAINDTPLDNPVTDATVWAGDAVVGKPARVAASTVIGRDYGSGEDNFRPSAVEAAELALIGAGGAVGSAARGGGRLTSRLGTALRGGDEAASGADDAVTAATRVTEETTSVTPDGVLPAGTSVIDNTGSTVTSGGDNLGRVADDVTENADDVADDALDVFNPRTGTGSPGSGGASAADDVTETTVQAGDDGLPALDDLSPAARGGDEAVETTVRAGDDGVPALDDLSPAARGGDDSGSIIDDATDPLRAGDDGAPRWADAAFRGGDDAAPALDDLSPAARGADDTGEAVARTGEDVADDSPGLFSRLTPDLGSRARTGGLLIGGGLAGAAATTVFSDDEVPDEFTATDANGTQYTFVASEVLQPENSDEFEAAATLYAVAQEQSALGFWVVFGADGNGNLILLGPNGNKRTSTLTPAQFENSLPGAPQSEKQQ